MKFLKLFLASSIIEFSEERRKIYLSLFNFNDYLITYTDYEIDIDRCEEIDINILKSNERTQDKISEMIVDSNICVFLIGKTVGTVTREELDLAIDNYKKNNKSIPIVFLFSNKNYDDTVYDAISLLKENSIPYINVDEYHIVIYYLLTLLEYIFDNEWELFIFKNKLCIEDIIIDDNIFESKLFANIENDNLKKKFIDLETIKEELLVIIDNYKNLNRGIK